MKIALAAIILSVFLPFFAFALEMPPPPKVSLLDNIFSSLRSASAKIESHVTPESAKEKGFWPWIRELSTELLGRAMHTAGSITSYISNKFESIKNNIENRVGEKIVQTFLSPVEGFIKNISNYIDLKINK